MEFISMLIISMASSIISVNSWFIIPDFCIGISYVITGLIGLLSLINYISVKNTAKEINNRWQK